jgi:hypothetical protein
VPLISFECNLPVFKHETLDIINILSFRNPEGTYNFCIAEPPSKFEEDRWLTKGEIEQIAADDRYGFMEIYFKMGSVSV